MPSIRPCFLGILLRPQEFQWAQRDIHGGKLVRFLSNIQTFLLQAGGALLY